MIIACVTGLGKSIEVLCAEDRQGVCTAIEQKITRDLKKDGWTNAEIVTRLYSTTGPGSKIRNNILNAPMSMTDWTTVDLRGLAEWREAFWLVMRHVPETTFVTLDI